MWEAHKVSQSLKRLPRFSGTGQEWSAWEELAFTGDTMNTDRTNEKLGAQLRLEQKEEGRKNKENSSLDKLTSSKRCQKRRRTGQRLGIIK